MDTGSIVALVSVGVTLVLAILGAARTLSNSIGAVSTSVVEVKGTTDVLIVKINAVAVQQERMEVEARERAHTLSGVRDRLASLEGQLDPAPFTRKRGQS